ncbi:C2 domain-containing protein [Blastocladiella britannica]|nr:C2 domain-containing protein [Blastocladiella britannica]
MSHQESAYEAGLRRHNEEIQAVLKAEQDLIRVQQQQAAMNAGGGQYGAPQPQYGAPQPQYGAPQPQHSAPQPQYSAPAAEAAPQHQAHHQPQPSASFNLRRVNIELVEARELKWTVDQLADTPDPYVKVYCGSNKYKTQVFEDAGRSPRFNNASIMADIPQDVQEITIEVWDYNKILPSVMLGRNKYHLGELRNGRREDKWLDLKDNENQAAGQIHVILNPLE